MGKCRHAPHLLRFADLPHEPCVYVAELSTGLVKVGAASSARGRMASLSAELKREHGAELLRFHIVSRPTYKGAFEAETRLVDLTACVAEAVPGRREFFAGATFEAVAALCEAACSLVRAPTVKPKAPRPIKPPRRAATPNRAKAPRGRGGHPKPPLAAYIADLHAGMTLDEIARKHGKANASVVHTALKRAGLPTCRKASALHQQTVPPHPRAVVGRWDESSCN